MMKFSCNSVYLSEMVSKVSLAVAPKSASIPALEGILIECKKDCITLTGYDLDMGIQCSLKAEVEEEGAIVLNARLFDEMLKKMHGFSVQLQTDERLLATISCGYTSYQILGIAAEEFPEMPEAESGTKLTIQDLTLKQMIGKTSFCAAQNTYISPVLCGCMFDVSDHLLRVIAVDGYRVAVTKKEIEDAPENLQFVVPIKTLHELCKLLSDEEKDKTTICVGKKHAVFTSGDYRIVTRLLEGEFIDYKSAVPEETNITITVDPKEFAKSIERVSVLVTEKISVMMKTQGNMVMLHCKSTLGQVDEMYQATVTGKEELHMIAYNNRYMLDALKHAECDEVNIQIDGPVTPIKIVPKEGDDFLFLVLPVRLKNE